MCSLDRRAKCLQCGVENLVIAMRGEEYCRQCSSDRFVMYLQQELGETYAKKTIIQSQRARLAAHAHQSDAAKKRRLTAEQRNH